MPRRLATLTVIASLVVLSLLSATAAAGILDDTKVALHLQDRTAKGICDPPAEGGTAPDVRVTQYNTSGEVGVAYNAYLITVGGDPIAGVSCGIEYDPVAARGVDVFDWVLCADLEFPNAGSNGEWPAAGGGNRMTFDTSVDCPGETVPGYEYEGTFTVFGSFYVYAYGDDELHVTQNMNLLSGPELTVGNCTWAVSDLPTSAAGWIAFSPTGSVQGCNPVLGPCDPWSPDPPECSVSPDMLDFGDVFVSGYADRSFTISNTGGGILSGSVIPGCDDFAVIVNGGDYALGAGQSRTVSVRFLPSSEGPHACSLSLGNTDCGEVACTGNGIPGGVQECSVSPDSLDFGTVLSGAYTDRNVVITNTGTVSLNGTVNISGTYYHIVSGGGAYTLLPGASRSVTVRFAPLGEGTYPCTLYVGTVCGPVYGSGIGYVVDYPICSLSAESLDFGAVGLGESADLSFTIANLGGGLLTGTVASGCGDFHVISGSGAYSLAAGTSRTVTVRYLPAAAGETSCVLSLGSATCSDMPLRGTGVEVAGCVLTPASLDFGYVPVGRSSDLSFTVTNATTATMYVYIQVVSLNFSIVSGGGSAYLPAGSSREVVVRFSPTSVTSYQCTIHIGGACDDVVATGQGWSCSGASNYEAVVALHAQAHPVKGEGPCTTDPVSASIPCDNFTVRWPLHSAADLYLVIARGNSFAGIGGLSCGILYNNGAVGGATMSDGSGVDLYSWTLCASGLEFPNGPTGLSADEWPASGGGIRLTWDVSVDCQTTVLDYQGVHATAGAFYVYAYTDDLFRVTANNNLMSGPELQVGSCCYAVTDLSPSYDAGGVGFGSRSGYNPCGHAVPVRLLSFTAERSAEGAVLAWKTGSASSDHLGFEVYRTTENDGRELISTSLLSGRTAYTFTDPAPPAAETEYWLGERSRTGSLEWHGPAVLPAATAVGSLALTQAPSNPFVTSTRFSFRLPEAGEVTVRIFDMAGREVARPFAGFLSSGEQAVEWNGRDARGRRLSAGAYLYRIETAQGSLSGKVIRLQ